MPAESVARNRGLWLSPYACIFHTMDPTRELERHVRELTNLGERNTLTPLALQAAADYIRAEFTALGLSVREQTFHAAGVPCRNLDATTKGFDPGVPHLLLGAHYDSAPGTPGADDNASAVAVMLALARRFSNHKGLARLRFVAFTNEEPPHFLTSTMGSRVFAHDCAARKEAISAMICLESLGVFFDEPGTQSLPVDVSRLNLPASFDPTVGNFLAVVGNGPSMPWARRFAERFDGCVPAIALELPEMELSDHLSFWECGFPAIMITDTALFRNAHYHLPSDTPEKLDYDRMREAARCIGDAIERWLNG